MGQQAAAILFGVRKPKGAAWRENEWGEILLLREYAKATSRADAPDEPRAYDDVCLVGFWVAVGRSGKDGVPSLDVTVGIDEIPTKRPYAAAYKRAVKRWEAFALWCSARNVTPPLARRPSRPTALLEPTCRLRPHLLT